MAGSRGRRGRPPLHLLLRFYLALKGGRANPASFYHWLIERYGARYATSKMTIYRLFGILCQLGLIRRVETRHVKGMVVETTYEVVWERWYDQCWEHVWACYRRAKKEGKLVRCEQPGPAYIIHEVVVESGGERGIRGSSGGSGTERLEGETERGAGETING